MVYISTKYVDGVIVRGGRYRCSNFSVSIVTGVQLGWNGGYGRSHRQWTHAQDLLEYDTLSPGHFTGGTITNNIII